MKAAGIGASLMLIVALVIALLTKLIAFVGFISWAINLLIILAFVLVFATVAFLVFRSWQNGRRRD